MDLRAYFDCLRAQIPGMLGQRLALQRYHEARRAAAQRIKLGLPPRPELLAEIRALEQQIKSGQPTKVAARKAATSKATGQKSATPKKPAQRAVTGDPLSAFRGMHISEFRAMQRANPNWWRDSTKTNWVA